ncbi:helix-turn-helix domain-containing protein [Streptomyces sp. NPDC004284]|uniref:helix-turn-helix domain-containing protein n=1 Tax=Streptomyces sp. NPDC004284 TaxID=3364695 RepID=UPI0036C0398E
MRRLREAAGLTQEELADLAGLSVRTIRDIELGRTARPYRRSLELIAQALGLNAEGAARLVRTRKARGAEIAEAGAAPTADDGPRAAQLPPVTGDLIGREDLIAAYERYLSLPGAAVGPRAPLLITGPAGVGKSMLATRLAHGVAHLYPDGQLFTDLHGHDAVEPLDPASVLRGFLCSLGVSPSNLPGSLSGLTALYRSLLADRRVLILIDNARATEQVRPLLPNSPGSAVLVTSRAQLRGLLIRDGAQLLETPYLSEPAATALLEEVIGPRRLRAEPAAGRELIRLCGGLPLALRVLAERAAQRPGLLLRDLVEELTRPGFPLDALDVPDDPASTLRTVLSWSYRALPPRAARLFRLLGLHEGPDIRLDAVARLTAAGSGSASLNRLAAELSVLVDAHLLESPAPGRYRFHLLVRLYAAERAAEEESTRAGGIAYAAPRFAGQDEARHRLDGKPRGAQPPARTREWYGEHDNALRLTCSSGGPGRSTGAY